MKSIHKLWLCLLAGLACSALLMVVPLGQTLQGRYVVSENSDESVSIASWPRQIHADGNTITVYQPQLDSWQDNRLTGGAAVSIQAASSPSPTYGVIWFSARTEVDRAAEEVTLRDIKITHSSLPKPPSGGPDYLQILRQYIPAAIQSLSLKQVEASLTVTQVERQRRQQPLENVPPRIYFRTGPAVLVLVDGPPALRPVPGTNLLRVINTRSLLLLDQESGTYYLYLRDRWLQAPGLQGPWKVAMNPPSTLEIAKKSAEAAQDADLMEEPSPEVQEALDRDAAPTIYVSTTPAELIETNGPPNFQPIAGTHLLWAQNSHCNLFLNTADQNYYVLISGRWYRSGDLERYQRPWIFVSGADLPKDFARISATHPAGDALPAVPGTLQAKQALISNSIPQTATVRRATAQLTVIYDGQPQFQEIEGTALQYAINTPTPIVMVAPGVYYACENGVWFTGGLPTGPWALATSVPPAIYTIPITCPINYVTNVFVYDATPEVVYVGYTPGYLGTYVQPFGCVVFGSGYRYHSWIGHVWFSAPITFGLGAVFDWTIDFGWSFGFGWGHGPIWRPWWGPWHDHDRWHSSFAHDHGPWRWHDANILHHNIYDRWDRHVVVSRPHLPARPAYRTLGHGNDIFAGRDGNVYRRGTNGWEERVGNQWHSVPKVVSNRNPLNVHARPDGPEMAGLREKLAYLDSIQQFRSRAQAQMNAARFNAGPGLEAQRPGSLRLSMHSVPRPGVFRPAVAPRIPSLGGEFGGFARRSRP
jgi:hypothetical protein